MANETVTKDAPRLAPKLKVLYNTKLAAELQKELGLKNPLEVPRLEKIVVGVGLGRAKDDKKLMEVSSNTLSQTS
jgi:large subunit ribosomal protein L5